ncbi:MAG: hypothetical protein ORN98_07820 [Alphaproteobacteria bacterium]|nr:hypothetical protein [Alphaproteobacteria bacterium]
MAPANYLHGTETIQRDNSPRQIATVKSAVIGLIGTAPIGPVNKPTLVLSERDAAQFGNDKTTSGGFTIPQAINAIYDQGAGTIIAINVLDPTRHKTAIMAEAVTLTGDSGVLAKRNIVAGSVVVKNQAATTTHVENTDYIIDYAAGTITRKGAAIANGASLKIDYAYADPSKVTAVDVQGQIDAATGARSGIKALNDCFNLFGFDAKILICPGYATKGATGVAPDLIAAAAA